MKALVISVGTGTLGTDENTKGLANALLHSVLHHSPDKVYFVVTRESREKTLPKVLEGMPGYEYEVVEVRNPDNLQQLYDDLRERVEEIRREYDRLVVDFTSGTKSMTAALSILGSLFGSDELSYISGKRDGGIVQPGTEQILSVRPYFAIAEQRLMMAVEFFNAARYEACASILNGILNRTKDRDIAERVEPILRLSEAYSLWDRFCHDGAFEMIKKVDMEELNLNKRFLGRLLDEKKRGRADPYILADLINNAKRRAECEQKYDDAVARLYRATELIAHYKLRENYGISPSGADPSAIPRELAEKWGVRAGEAVKLPLERSYELLSAKGCDLGAQYLNDEELKDLLSRRNRSILAHGHEPVKKETYERLVEKVLALARQAVDGIDALLDDSKFIRLEKMRASHS